MAVKKSVVYEKLFRCACVSVVLATVGWGIYAALSDSGFIPKGAIIPPDSEVGKILSYIRENI
jgi:hypothetical protein